MAAGSRFASAASLRGIGAEPLGEKDERRRRRKWRGRELTSPCSLSRPESPFDPLPLLLFSQFSCLALIIPSFPLVHDPSTAAPIVVGFISFHFLFLCSASFACLCSIQPSQVVYVELVLCVSADSNLKLCQNVEREKADLLLLPGKFFISPKSQTQTK